IPELCTKLKAPAKGVKLECYCDTDGADIAENYVRRVKRKRPANKEGEELRDVILWLLTLHYAKSKSSAVAFVSTDGGFWDGEKVHEQILQDVASYGVDIQVFRTLDGFVKQSAPPPQQITASDVEQVFD